jgi:hypothetical protein
MRLKPPLQRHAVRLRGLLVAGSRRIAPTIVAASISNGTVAGIIKRSDVREGAIPFT